jgi:2,3-bisphosphoglycerate-independent phosphoglycerate mutase
MMMNRNVTLFNFSENELPDRIIFFFIDGIGLGSNDTRKNPCMFEELEFFNSSSNNVFPKSICHNGIALGVDANLEIDGLPQSATGQTTLFTGINASKLLGRHLNAYPNQLLRNVLEKQSIFKILKNAGLKCAFLNAFRPPFFDYNPEQILKHLSVTTVMNHYAGLPFFGINDIRENKSVYHDITNMDLIDKGFEVPRRSPEEAGEIVAKQSFQYDFLLFEYFQTDKAGHSRDMERAVNELLLLEKFLGSIITNMGKNTMLIVASDHGNIEDISVKGHTRNLALTLLFGPGADVFSEKLLSLTDFVPAIKSLFGINNPQND